MKRLSALIIIAVLMLSGCAVQTASQNETFIHESQSEPAVSETTRAITPATTPTPAQTTCKTSQTAAETTRATTQAPAETSSKTTGTTPGETAAATIPAAEYAVMLKRDVLVLMLAYPDYVAGVEMENGSAYLVMQSGKRLLYDDQRKKTFAEKIADADIQDMLETIYPLTEISTLMDADVDPGRTRAYALLDEIYGSSKDAITKKLISVDYGDQRLPFNQEAGAAALASASAAAADLVKDQPQIAEYLYPSSGTFNYRVIAGTDRLSPHAYGIAIDLKSSSDGYWRWASPAAGEELIKIYPQDLVRLFEKNGFVWGGKWNHFDIFHFEYRPEIIIKAKYFPGAIDLAQPWYQGADTGNDSVNQFIAQIDASLG